MTGSIRGDFLLRKCSYMRSILRLKLIAVELNEARAEAEDRSEQIHSSSCALLIVQLVQQLNYLT